MPPAEVSALDSLARITRRSIMQKVRGQALAENSAHSPSTACRSMISGSISLASPAFFSTFPHGTRALSVEVEYLALDLGRPRFPQDFPCPVVLGKLLGDLGISHTGLSPSMVYLSRYFCYP